ncbi:MAG: tyrosine--tRNA ligase [Thermoplasmata archaeon]|nr:tyrosine--tRNA ligase [Thermoplasmata archaeon]MCI4356333.1 tyrosine--tRNA ligase [Thermoplasmata archaeon]
MDREERVERVARHTEELLTREELAGLFERTERPRAYIGFEPSGRLTAGHLVCARKMIDLQEAGCELTVFLADWHAWINDKLGGSLERIGAAGRYMRSAFQALGVSEGETHWRWANELTGSSEYWARVVRVAKTTSLARTKRAMTILGRTEEEAQLDTAKLFYPAMQASDIFELPVDIAYAGVDQRRAHVLAREVAHHYGWPVPVAVHTPLVSSLKGGGRMDVGHGPERKMSKSDPTSAIVLPATFEEVTARMNGAFCPAKEVEGNPVVELALYVVFPWRGRLTIHRAEKHGGDRSFEDATTFRAAWVAGEVHPADLKAAVAAEVAEIARPVTEYFLHHPSEAPETAGI